MSSTFGMSAVNCTSWPPLQANPDISGIGLIVSFLTTAYLTLICCVIKAILDQDKFKTIGHHRLQRWSSSLTKAIMTFSDQQLLTGISIIIGGFSQLGWGLDIYHFQAVGNLAWFSTFSHILTLTILRENMQQNRKIKILRVLLMGVLVLMLLVITAPVGYLNSEANSYYFEANSYYISLDFPAWCLYHPSLEWGDTEKHTVAKGTSGYNEIYSAFTLFIIIYGYLSRVFLLFPGKFSSLVFDKIFHVSPDQPWRSITTVLERLEKDIRDSRSQRFPIKAAAAWLGHKLLYSFLVFITAGKQLYGSKTWELTWLSLALVWGSVRLFAIRGNWAQYPNRDINVFDDEGDGNHYSEPAIVAEENIWGFGQIVSIALLILPLVTFIEEYFSYEEKLPSSQNASRATANYQALPASPNTPKIITELIDKQWYKSLLVLWYLFTCYDGVLIILVLLFPIDGFKALQTAVPYKSMAAVVAVEIATLWVLILHNMPEWKIFSYKIAVAFSVIFWLGFQLLLLFVFDVIFEFLET